MKSNEGTRNGKQKAKDVDVLGEPLAVELNVASTLLWCMPLVFIGSGLQGYANGTADAVFVAMILLGIGAAVVSLVFPGAKAELRAFLLSYAICVLVGGLAQCYSLATFGVSQSTMDANTFLNMVSAKPPFVTMETMRTVNAPLAVLLWQKLYAFAWLLGFKFGPYTGVLFNAMTVGLSGALTVQTARELFGNDTWRLRRVGTLFAFCGMFWLFGAIMIRDCFTLFVNMLVLWTLVRWLCRPTARNAILAIAIGGISCFIMWYLRKNSVVLFGLVGLLAGFCWYWQAKVTLTRLVATAMVPAILLVGNMYLQQYLVASMDSREEGAEFYTEIGHQSSRNNSLGMKLVVNQPLPIRLVLGTGTMVVFPIPLWGYLQPGVMEYGLIKTYQGFCQFLLLPWVLIGLLMVAKETFRNRGALPPALFVAAYALMTLEAVVATSLEMRHLGQFMPAFLLIAVLPDTRIKNTRIWIRRAAMFWYAVVILLHAAWWMVR